MKYFFSIALSTILIISFFACSSDYSDSLGNGYFYRHEGYPLNDILSENVLGKQVPATVIAYDYDDEFIIAKQRPELPQDILYNKTYEYKNGADTVYYWLILKKEHISFGPLDKQEFKKIREKYHVPSDLELEE